MAKSPAALSICIVTPDLVGPVRNGGIGTACKFLAQELAEAGHALTVLFTQCDSSPQEAGAEWLQAYASLGIEVVVAGTLASAWAEEPRYFPELPALAMASRVHAWLSVRHFDCVILMDWQGHGFYALQAKRAGLAYAGTQFITQLHSPSLWHAVHNADISAEPLHTLLYVMERKSVELADAVISPSRYMLEWVRAHGFKPPERCHVLPNLISRRPGRRLVQTGRAPVRELVFFGRLEYRKGLGQFCDALDRMAAAAPQPSKVIFLGKFARMGGEHAGVYLARRARRWTFPVEFQTGLDQDQALSFLSVEGRLAVMPSVADNSPYTVYECLAEGLPFLARDVGGVAELIQPVDRPGCMFDDRPATLARMLVDALACGALRPRLAFDLDQTRKAWQDTLHALAVPAMAAPVAVPAKARKPRKAAPPLISVCLTHFQRPRLLAQALASLRAQDQQELFELILVDDGSQDRASLEMLDGLIEEFQTRHWTLLRLENGYLGRARNAAAKLARGQYLLFMDDDNIARPAMIRRFAEVARFADADLVTAMFEVFSGDAMPDARTPVLERFLPLGDALAYAAVSNVIGDANSLIRRSSFEQLGGFSEDYGVGHEDFELFLRALLAGARVQVIPEPLFWYRRNGSSMLSATNAAANRARSLRPWIDMLPPALAELAVLAHGLAHGGSMQRPPPPIAESPLSTQDQQHLCRGDPDRQESVLALARWLMLEGQTALVGPLIDTLMQRADTAAASASLRTLQNSLAALDALRRQAWSELSSLIDAHARRARQGAGESLSFFKPLLQGLCAAGPAAAGLLRRCARQWLDLSGDRAPDLLLAVRYLIPSGELEAAVGALDRALHLQDAQYLQRRPDVEEAVRQRRFANGLEHFLRHGQAEGMVWPGGAELQALLPLLLDAARHHPLSLRPDSQARLMLALRAFVPAKPA